jgi:hypothetical protein
MAVALLKGVAHFIAALYHLCKRYLGNSPLQLEPKCFGAISNLSGACRMIAPAMEF